MDAGVDAGRYVGIDAGRNPGMDGCWEVAWNGCWDGWMLGWMWEPAVSLPTSRCGLLSGGSFRSAAELVPRTPESVPSTLLV